MTVPGVSDAREEREGSANDSPESGAAGDFGNGGVRRGRARPLLGTQVVVWACGESPSVDRGLREALDRVQEVQDRMSFFCPDSDISRVNRDAWRRPVPVSPITRRVLRLAERVWRMSGGVFDPTCGGALRVGGFLDPPLGAPRPDPRADYGDVRLDASGRVSFRKRLWLDLGGIAKGFAVDRAMAVLVGSGARRAMVNAGGDMAVRSDRAEPIHARHPDSPNVVIPLGVARRACLASSAATVRRIRGRSPYVRFGVCVPLTRGVTVRAGTTAVADALTKVALLAPARAARLARVFGATLWRLPDVGERTFRWREAAA